MTYTRFCELMTKKELNDDEWNEYFAIPMDQLFEFGDKYSSR